MTISKLPSTTTGPASSISRPFTMADLLAFLATAPEVEPKRRRDLTSAVRRLCHLAKRDPQHVPADVTALRGALRAVHPAHAGISAKTLANLKANGLAALRMLRADEATPSRRQPLPPAWQALYDQLPDPLLRRGLSRFVHFCAARAIRPEAVDDAALETFAHTLRTETFIEKPNDLLRRTARLWNRAVGQVPGWPPRRLPVPSFRTPRRTIPIAELPQPLQDDVSAHLRWLQGEDLFSPYPPPRVCRPSTAAQRLRHIEGAASALIAGGFDRDRLTSLAELVAPDAVKTILRQYLARTNNEPTQYHRDLAKALINVARHWVRLDTEHLAALMDLKRRLGADRSGLTDKNKAALRQFDDATNQKRLLLLPRRLAEEAARRPTDDSHAAVTVQIALALEILMMAPMRMGNLIRLRVDQHVVHHGKEVHLVLPSAETKGGEEIVYPLTGEFVVLFDLYLRRYRPRLCKADSPWLIPTIDGKCKSQQTLSQQIGKTIRDRTGLTLTPHQFRHLAAKLLLEQRPGNYEGARQLLAHRNLKSTTNFYTGLETPQAARHYDALIEQKRSDFEETLSEKLRKPRRRR